MAIGALIGAVAHYKASTNHERSMMKIHDYQADLYKYINLVDMDM